MTSTSQSHKTLTAISLRYSAASFESRTFA
jgi:hypothetical protein